MQSILPPLPLQIIYYLSFLLKKSYFLLFLVIILEQWIYQLTWAYFFLKQSLIYDRISSGKPVMDWLILGNGWHVAYGDTIVFVVRVNSFQKYLLHPPEVWFQSHDAWHQIIKLESYISLLETVLYTIKIRVHATNKVYFFAHKYFWVVLNKFSPPRGWPLRFSLILEHDSIYYKYIIKVHSGFLSISHLQYVVAHVCLNIMSTYRWMCWSHTRNNFIVTIVC